MLVLRVPVGRTIGGLGLTLLVAACSVGAPGPTSVPAAATDRAVSAAPSTSAMASAAPETVAPATASPAAKSGGGRYGGGGGGTVAPAPGLLVKAATTAIGPVLTGADGLTLYTHAGDSSNHSTCSGGCAGAWPPVSVTAGSKVTAGVGVQGRLGTFKRADGTTQVTYNTLPLYTWPGDAAPGDTTGQGIGGFKVATP